MGLDARIGTEMGLYRRLPLVSGKGAYYLSTAVNLFKGIHKPYEVELNDEFITGNHTMICVCNGRHYGGSFNPVPDAEPDDGLLDVLLVEPVNLLQIAMVIGKYQDGKYADYPELIRHFRTNQIRIRCFEDSVVNLDGESMCTQDITFSVSDHKLRFFYPRGLTYSASAAKQEKTGAI
jgi:diacylglycerol kinase family enzyme